MKKLTKKQLLCFGVGALGIDLSYGLVNSYFFKFTNTRLMVPASFLTLVVILSRIWDGFNDPMMGTIVDNTKTRWGKFRPWIFLGATLNAIVLVLMFIDPAYLGIQTMAGVKAFVAIVYLFWGMTFTMVDIPYWSMIPALSNDPEERNVVSAVPRFFSGLAQFVVAGGTIIVVNMIGGVSNETNADLIRDGQIKGYPFWAAILAVMFLAGLYTTTFTTKERIKTPKTDSFSLKKAFGVIKQNDQLIVFIFTAFTFNTAWYLMTALGPYFFEFIAGNESMVTVFAAVCGLGQVLGLLFMPYLAKKYGKKKVVQIAFVTAIIGMVMMLIISRFYMNNASMALFIPFAVFALLACMGIGLSFTCQTVMLADIVDYGEYKIGKRTDSIVFSMKSFLLKFALTAQTLIMGLGLSLSGFDAQNKLYQDGEILLSEFSKAPKETISLMMFAIPPILALIALIIFSKRYKLYGELADKVNKFVVERHKHDMDEEAGEASES